MAEKYGTVHFTREFNAPREQVWKAWTTPQLMKEWWGPEGYSGPTIEQDLRVGGKYNYAMQAPDGKITYSGGVFKEIVPMEKIVSTDSFTDKNGNKVDPTTYGLPGKWADPLDVTIDFADASSGKTLLTVNQVGLPPEMVEDCIQGWASSLDKMDKLLERMKQR